MAVQVGSFCYADAAAGAAAACAAHSTSITVAGSNLVTVSCSGAIDGKMQIVTMVSPVDGSTAGVSHLVEVAPDFPPCRQGEIMDALLVVAFAVLAVWMAGPWAYKRISALLNWGRGEA